jgi:ribosome assembly protein 1
LLPRELNSKDLKGLLQNIMTQWLPLSSAGFKFRKLTVVLLSVLQQVPNPAEAQSKRVPYMLNIQTNTSLNSPDIDAHTSIIRSMVECDSKSPETVIYVSKMFSISKKDLPTIRKPPMTSEQLKELRETVKLKPRSVSEYTPNNM